MVRPSRVLAESIIAGCLPIGYSVQCFSFVLALAVVNYGCCMADCSCMVAVVYYG